MDHRSCGKSVKRNKEDGPVRDRLGEYAPNKKP